MSGQSSLATVLSAAAEHHAAGRLDAAMAAYQQALGLDPQSFVALNNLGALLDQHGRYAEARRRFVAALAVRPNDPMAARNLADAFRRDGLHAEAIEAYRRALSVVPDSVPCQFNLGVSLMQLGRNREAVVAFRQAVRLEPTLAEAYSNIGCLSNELGDYQAACDASQKAVELKGQLGPAHSNLGLAQQSLGMVDEAITSFRRAVQLCSGEATMHSNLLYALNFTDRYSPAEIFAEHRRWAVRHADPLTSSAAPHDNDRSPDRPLRVGYVSAHFREHAVNSFTEGIPTSHDRRQVEVYCYSDVAPALCDAATARLKEHAAGWRDMHAQTDQQLCEQVRRDRIDILVDLAGHIGGNRLLAFARRPAPVQVTYIGYQNTTGMTAMDYRLTDDWSDPPGTDACYTEQLVRLPRSFFCYLPSREAPAVTPLPAMTAGHVTFGSFNYFGKIGPAVLETWARLLKRVPHSRLLLLAPASTALEARVRGVFAGQGIEEQRVELVPRCAYPEYLRTIQRADIALDSFPFNGHTTTCDALWLGVPVVMLAGNAYASRFGGSALVNLGLEELITRSTEQYLESVARLAADTGRLADLRARLRPLMATSPLVDAAGFTRNLEDAYRAMWRRWCAQAK